jgi:hypothetical protein
VNITPIYPVFFPVLRGSNPEVGVLYGFDTHNKKKGVFRTITEKTNNIKEI